jgi:hypothetical protein
MASRSRDSSCRCRGLCVRTHLSSLVGSTTRAGAKVCAIEKPSPAPNWVWRSGETFAVLAAKIDYTARESCSFPSCRPCLPRCRVCRNHRPRGRRQGSKADRQRSEGGKWGCSGDVGAGHGKVYRGRVQVNGWDRSARFRSRTLESTANSWPTRWLDVRS